MTVHTPPATYILRDIIDVDIPMTVRWLPVAPGWKVLAACFVVAILVGLYMRARVCWYNRYRKEALRAVSTLNSADVLFEYHLLMIVKSVLIYLDKKNTGKFGNDLLDTLDAYMDAHDKFNNKIGQQWLLSTVNPTHHLSVEKRRKLAGWVKEWLIHHQNIRGNKRGY